MQALIFATNEVPCMEPLSQNMPTPLIPIINKPVMAITIEELSKQGIRDIIVNLHELGGSIESFFGTGRRWGVDLQYVLQKDPVGNGGSLARSAPHIKSDHLLFLPGDKLYFADYKALQESHTGSKAKLTVVMHQSTPLSGFPTTMSESDYTGIFIINRTLIKEIEKNLDKQDPCDILSDLVPYLENRGESVNYETISSYQDPFTSYEQYNDTQQHILGKAYQSSRNGLNGSSQKGIDIEIPGTRYGHGVWVGKNCVIHPSVRITPPVVIGDNTQIGREVELGPNVVIGSHVIIDDEATVRQSTIMNYTYIGHLVNVENRFVHHNLIIDNKSSEHIFITDPFILGEAAPRVVNRSLRRAYDLTWALLLTLLLLPIMLIIGVITRLSHGVIFEKIKVFGTTYKQIHAGNKASPESFTLTHFATSRAENETHSRFGNWLRSTELYRLPELFDVISGKLSLVGVRPIQTKALEQFTEEWQYQKFSYSCGLTGLWYTEGSSHLSDESSIIFDVYYVAMRDFWEDLRIFRTTPVVWWHKMTQNS